MTKKTLSLPHNCKVKALDDVKEVVKEEERKDMEKALDEVVVMATRIRSKSQKKIKRQNKTQVKVQTQDKVKNSSSAVLYLQRGPSYPMQLQMSSRLHLLQRRRKTAPKGDMYYLFGLQLWILQSKL